MIHRGPIHHHGIPGEKDSLQSFLDGELPEPRRAALAAHLRSCTECEMALRRLQEQDRRIAAARPEPAFLSPAASQALLDRALAHRRAQSRVERRWLQPAWGLAAALVAATLGLAARTMPPTVDWISIADGRPSGAGRRSTVAAPRNGNENSVLTGSPSGVPPHAGDHPLPAPPRAAPRRGPSPHRSPTGTVRPPGAPVPVEPRAEVRPRRALPRRYPLAAADGFSEEWPVVETSMEDASAASLASLEWEASLAADLAAVPDERYPAGSSPQDPMAADPAAVVASGAIPPDYVIPGLIYGGAELDPATIQAISSLVTAPPEENDTRLRLAEALAADPGTARLVADALAGGSPPDSRGPWLAAAPTAVPSASAPESPLEASGQLVVSVTAGTTLSPVIVTSAPEGTPGYARACALRPDADGGATWTQATVTTDETGPRLALVMLGAGPWNTSWAEPW